MTSRTVSGGVAGRARAQLEDLVELLGGVAQIRLEHHPDRGPASELRLGQQLQHEVEHRLARVERLHVDVDVGAELAAPPQQRPQPRRGVAPAELRRVGTQQRGQRRDLDRHVRARQRSDAVALEHRARGPAARRAGELARAPSAQRAA